MIDKRVLFIAGHEFLYNPQNGGQKCSLRNYRMIQNIFGKQNVFLCMFSNFSYADLSDNERVFPTQKNSIELLINTIWRRNVCDRETLRKFCEYVKGLELDCIFVDSSTIGYLVSRLHIELPIMTFFHNIEKNYAWNKFLYEGKKYIVAYWSYTCNEKRAVELSDRIILLNERDDKEMQKYYGRKADFFLPISFDDEFDNRIIQDKTDEKIQLLFVGSLFQPNINGLRWFIKEVMSALDRKKYILKVVGKNLETLRQELERENVEIIGTVDELSSYYYCADAVVIPIFYGDGMKVKTAEAMMYGKKILATQEALEGYKYEGINGIQRCDTATDFIREIEQLQKKSVYEDVRKNFIENYNTKVVEDKFRFFIQEMLNQ